MKRYRNVELSQDEADLEDEHDQMFTPDEAFDIDAEGVERIAARRRIEREKENIL